VAADFGYGDARTSETKLGGPDNYNADASIDKSLDYQVWIMLPLV
jgi:hypothetical protein